MNKVDGCAQIHKTFLDREDAEIAELDLVGFLRFTKRRNGGRDSARRRMMSGDWEVLENPGRCLSFTVLMFCKTIGRRFAKGWLI